MIKTFSPSIGVYSVVNPTVVFPMKLETLDFEGLSQILSNLSSPKDVAMEVDRITDFVASSKCPPFQSKDLITLPLPHDHVFKLGETVPSQHLPAKPPHYFPSIVRKVSYGYGLFAAIDLPAFTLVQVFQVGDNCIVCHGAVVNHVLRRDRCFHMSKSQKRRLLIALS